MMILFDGLGKRINTEGKKVIRKVIDYMEISKHTKSWSLGIGEKGKGKAEIRFSCSLHK